MSDYERELRDSLRRIPWSSLSKESREKIKLVVRNMSLFRRMPVQAVYCDADIYRYLLKHPDLVVAYWEQLGVTQVALRELDENRYFMKETTGTIAKVEVLYRTDDMYIVYARGQYRGPFLARSIDGESVLVLRNRYGRDEDGEPFVACVLDTFIRIDNIGADFLARLFSTSLGKIADSNFEQTVAFIGQVSDAASTNPEALNRITRRVGGVREGVRYDFIDLVGETSSRAYQRYGRHVMAASIPAEAEEPYARKVVVPEVEFEESTESLENDPYFPFRMDELADISELKNPVTVTPDRTAFSMPNPSDSLFSTSETIDFKTEPLPRSELVKPVAEIPKRTGAVFGTPKIVRPVDD